MTGKWRMSGNLVISLATTAFTSASAALRNRGAASSISLNSMDSRCPTAVADEKRLAMQFYLKRPAVKAARTPSIRVELLRMAHEDQRARIALIKHGNTDPELIRAVRAVDASNLERLKQTFAKYGVPTPGMVGHNGMKAALLLLQHQDRDPAWQRKWAIRQASLQASRIVPRELRIIRGSRASK